MEENKSPVEKWIIEPFRQLSKKNSISGILLFSCAIIALILTNSPWGQSFHHFWEIEISLSVGDYTLTRNIHHWINDGLMAVFFFTVGLHLKREIIAGELRNPKDTLFPIIIAVAGMIFPALIYTAFNYDGAISGWGIPMATDIAFALGVLYLLGDRVPMSVKIFLTAVAIVDDIGAVLVIAIFYTPEVNLDGILVGAIACVILIIANISGVRSGIFYAVIGVSGLWLSFLVSGVHPTIAAVIVAFTIPGRVKIDAETFSDKLLNLFAKFKRAKPNPDVPTVTPEQYHSINKIRQHAHSAITPLQKLEDDLGPFVTFVVLPLFALANAGVEISGNFFSQIGSDVTLGTGIGLLGGKLLATVGVGMLLVKTGWVKLPSGMKSRHLYAIGFLMSIGFTMSLFISELAFDKESFAVQAKIGILLASVTGSVFGYLVMRKSI